MKPSCATEVFVKELSSVLDLSSLTQYSATPSSVRQAVGLLHTPRILLSTNGNESNWFVGVMRCASGGVWHDDMV